MARPYVFLSGASFVLAGSLFFTGCSSGGSTTPPASSAPTQRPSAAPSVSPSASPPTPTPAPLTISGLPAGGAVLANSVYTLSAAVAASHSSRPLAALTVTYSLDNPAIGKISGNTLTTGLVNASGNLLATDSTGNTGKTPISVLSNAPVSVNSSATFSGTLTQTTSRYLPAPAATPPPVTTASTVTVAGTTGGPGTLNGVTSEFTNVLQETDSAPLVTSAYTTTEYENITAPLSPGAPVNLVELGATQTAPGGVTTTVSYPAPAILDVIPAASTAWSFGGASVYSELDPQGTTVSKTTSSNGLYTETDTFAAGTLESLTVNADQSAQDVFTDQYGSMITFSFAAPTTGTCGALGSSSILITVTSPAQATQQATVGCWYPQASFYTDSTTERVGQTIPASACPSLLSTVGTTGNVVQETVGKTDPILGTFESKLITSYIVDGYGVVCTVLHDELDDYYDESGQTPALIATRSTPIQRTVTDEVLVLSAAAKPAARARSAESVSFSAGPRAISQIFEHHLRPLYEERRINFSRSIAGKLAGRTRGVK